jgi:hypothetical protein
VTVDIPIPKDALKIVMCRSAEGTLEPGAWTGYQCRVCKKELQVTPTGRLQLDEGGIPVCARCGMEFVKGAGERLAGVVINPAAQRNIRKALRDECDFCGAKEDRFHVWRVRPFSTVIKGRRVTYGDGKWRACGSCADLIVAKDVRTLAARCEVMLGDNFPFLQLFLAFMDARESETFTTVEVL